MPIFEDPIHLLQMILCALIVLIILKLVDLATRK
jgi:hypothetical protein